VRALSRDNSTEPAGETRPLLSSAPAPAPDITPRRHHTRNYGRYLYPVIPGIVLLGLWQVLSGPVLPKLYVSDPWDVIKRLHELFSSGSIFIDMRYTGIELIIGYAIGCATGASVGFWLGRSPRAARALEPYIMALYGIPMITLAPLFIIWLGIGIWSKIVIAAIMVFFIMFSNVYVGVKNVNRDWVSVAQVMGAGRVQLVRHVFAHAASPFVFMGMRAGLPFAVIGVVVGEFISAFHGLGLFLQQASTTFDPAGVFAGIIILLVWILVLKAVIGLIERRVLRWNSILTDSHS